MATAGSNTSSNDFSTVKVHVRFQTATVAKAVVWTCRVFVPPQVLV